MIKKSLLTFCITLLVLLASCASVEKHNLQVTKLHSVEDLHEDIDKVYKQLQRHHPHLYQFTSKEVLDYKFDSLKMAIKEPMDSRTFYKQLAAVTKYVGQGHMSLSPPGKHFDRKERKALKGAKFDINNLDFEYLDETLFVSNARGADSVLINAEVLKVEGETPQDLIKKYSKIIASDGYNTTFHNRVAGRRFMSYYFYDKGRFDSISLTFRNSDSTFVKSYKRILKIDTTALKTDSLTTDSIAIEKPKVVKLTKAERKAKKQANKAKRKYNRNYGYIASRNEYTRNLNFVGADNVVGLLKIRGFSNGNYKHFYDESFKTLDSLQTEVLVIDLRNNFGGRLNEITYLYSYLTDKNFTMINPSEVNTRFPLLKSVMSNTTPTTAKVFAGMMSPVLLTIDLFKTKKKDDTLYYTFKSAKEQKPKPLNFKGEIYVLINGNSFSASSILSTKLQGDERATFVGEETGGAYNGTVAGFYKVYEMPHTKVRARIGLAHIDAPYKTTPDGYGVKPDVEILPTYEDRLHHIDPELQWVLEDIEG
ncbi:S41 family peptidase [Winogradskyella psychrotolerans]|uniref:S41 family peptidase n=1 Tax=Winogradskyella psychrotolerans TaxID=1344585 RepID=UPI001C073459|nr:S41 family peptidase [Winogradskyella psychrotolerans]MBU2928870.1 peptidase S41 [Winogradskyella psychrotolerans]